MPIELPPEESERIWTEYQNRQKPITLEQNAVLFAARLWRSSRYGTRVEQTNAEQALLRALEKLDG